MIRRTIFLKRLLTAIVALSSACGYNEDDVPTTVSITFDESKNYFADGITKIPIEVTIPNESAPAFRQITLYTDAGTFENGDTVILLDLRLIDTASATLTAGVTPNTYAITAQAGSGTTAYKIARPITLEKIPSAEAFKSISV